MLKNEKARTRSADAIARAGSSATTTKCRIKTITKTGARLLATAVIRSALYERPVDTAFFESEMFDFWASLAYGGKPDYIDGIDIPSLIRNDVKKVGHPRLK